MSYPFPDTSGNSPFPPVYQTIFTGPVQIGNTQYASPNVPDFQLGLYANQNTFYPSGTLGAIYGQLISQYSGGAANDPSTPVVGAIRGYSQVATSVTYSNIWGGLFVSDNLSYQSQSGGVYAQGNSWYGGRAWGGVIESNELGQNFTAAGGQTAFTIGNGYTPNNAYVVRNRSGVYTVLTRTTDYIDTSGTSVTLNVAAQAGDIYSIYSGKPAYGKIGIEVDNFSMPGNDSGANSDALGNRIIGGFYGYCRDRSILGSTICEIGAGLAVFTGAGDANTVIRNGLFMQGNFTNGINLVNATITGNAIRLADTHTISFSSSSSRTLGWATNLLNYANAGTTVFAVNDNGSGLFGNGSIVTASGYTTVNIYNASNGGLIKGGNATDFFQLQSVSGGCSLASSGATIIKGSGTEMFRADATGIGFFGNAGAAKQTITGALSTVTDAAAKAVLTSIINALVAYHMVASGTT